MLAWQWVKWYIFLGRQYQKPATVRSPIEFRTGRLVGRLTFKVRVRWENVKQAVRGQLRERGGFSEHSEGPGFLESFRSQT